MVKKYVLVICGILGYRFLFCLSGFLRTLYYEKQYKDYIFGKRNDFAACTAPVKKLFKQAGLMDTTFTESVLAGYGQISTGRASVVENLNFRREDVMALALGMFSKAKGTFRMNMMECISPLYWVQLVVFLPVKLCGYLGISETKAIPKLLQAVYWLSAPLLLVFRSQLYEFIVQLLQQAK